MRDKSCATRLLCTIIILFVLASVSFSQELKGLTAFATIIKPSKSLNEGFGGGISADFHVSKAIFVRPAYDFITADTNKGTFLCTFYRRHYISLSIMYLRKFGFAWFPFIDTGVGYYFHELRARVIEGYNITVVKKCDFEELKNGFGLHITPGIRVQITPRLMLNLIGKMLFYNTKKSRFVDIYGNRLNEASVTNLNLSYFQVSWGITLLF